MVSPRDCERQPHHNYTSKLDVVENCLEPTEAKGCSTNDSDANALNRTVIHVITNGQQCDDAARLEKIASTNGDKKSLETGFLLPQTDPVKVNIMNFLGGNSLQHEIFKSETNKCSANEGSVRDGDSGIQETNIHSAEEIPQDCTDPPEVIKNSGKETRDTQLPPIGSSKTDSAVSDLSIAESIVSTNQTEGSRSSLGTMSTLCPTASTSLHIDGMSLLSSIETLKDTLCCTDDLNNNYTSIETETGSQVRTQIACSAKNTKDQTNTETSINMCKTDAREEEKQNVEGTPDSHKRHVRRGSYTLDKPSPVLLKVHRVNSDGSPVDDSDDDRNSQKSSENSKPFTSWSSWNASERTVEYRGKEEHLKKYLDQLSLNPQSQMLPYEDSSRAKLFSSALGSSENIYNNIQPITKKNLEWDEQQDELKENAPPMTTWFKISSLIQTDSAIESQGIAGRAEITSCPVVQRERNDMKSQQTVFGFSSPKFNWSIQKMSPDRKAKEASTKQNVHDELEKQVKQFEQKRKQVYEQQQKHLTDLFRQQQEEEKELSKQQERQVEQLKEAEVEVIGSLDRCESAPPDNNKNTNKQNKVLLETRPATALGLEEPKRHNFVGIEPTNCQPKSANSALKKRTFHSDDDSDNDRSIHVTVRSFMASPNNSPLVTVRSTSAWSKTEEASRRYFVSPLLQRSSRLSSGKAFSHEMVSNRLQYLCINRF